MKVLKHIYDREIKEKLYPLEKKRKSILYKNYLLAFSIFLLVWIISLIAPALHEYSASIFIIGLLLSIFVNFTIHNLSPAQKHYHQEVKELIILTFVKLYQEKFEYRQKQYIAPIRFLNSGFCKEKFHKSVGSDLILFDYQGYSAQFSFFTTFKRGGVHRMRIPNSGRAIEVLFRGFLLIIDIPESMQNERLFFIEKMKNKGWRFNEDANSVYFAKESDIIFFKNSVFSTTQSYLNFAESMKVLQQVIDI